jgi:RHS repeat-associated protein
VGNIDDSGNKSGETRFYYHTDHLGSVTMITDESGNVAWSDEFTPFGSAADSTKKPDGGFKFASYDYDEDIQLNYALARWQDPETGRFTSLDPARSGMNWYTYCLNNPLGLVDPLGLTGEMPGPYDGTDDEHGERGVGPGTGGGPGSGGPGGPGDGRDWHPDWMDKVQATWDPFMNKILHDKFGLDVPMGGWAGRTKDLNEQNRCMNDPRFNPFMQAMFNAENWLAIVLAPPDDSPAYQAEDSEDDDSNWTVNDGVYRDDGSNIALLVDDDIKVITGQDIYNYLFTLGTDAFDSTGLIGMALEMLTNPDDILTLINGWQSLSGHNEQIIALNMMLKNQLQMANISTAAFDQLWQFQNDHGICLAAIAGGLQRKESSGYFQSVLGDFNKAKQNLPIFSMTKIVINIFRKG